MRAKPKHLALSRLRFAPLVKRLFVSLSLFAILAGGLWFKPSPSMALPGEYSFGRSTYLEGDYNYWNSIAMSDDGTTMVTGRSWDGPMYISKDSGITWQVLTSAGIRDWRSFAMSADGTTIAAADYGGVIYVSSNSGTTWTAGTGTGNQAWYSVTMSADGTKLAAVGFNTAIYTSTDSGTTWTPQAGAGTRHWESVAMSADGTRIAAVGYAWPTGYIYTNGNSGTGAWTQKTGAGSNPFTSVAMSSDGVKLAVSQYGSSGKIFTSDDFAGDIWVERVGAGAKDWTSIAMSSNGSTMIATPWREVAHTSTDAGTTWTARPGSSADKWQGLDISADGSTVAIAAEEGGVWISRDSGTTWSKATVAGSRNWNLVQMSDDGSTIAATDYGQDSIYISTNSGTTWTKVTDAGSRVWTAIAISPDGSTIAAGAWNGYIYTSSDRGATWTERTSSGTGPWREIAMSSDATTLAAIRTGSGYIYTSDDSGSTWHERTGAGTNIRDRLRMSDDGSVIAISTNGFLHTSNDKGVTWQQSTGAGNRNWNHLEMSADGSTILAMTWGSTALYRSTDSGASWTGSTNINNLTISTLSINTDGTKIVAVPWDGRIYISKDSGASWEEQNKPTSPAPQTWSTAKISADGQRIVAINGSSAPFTTTTSGDTWTAHDSITHSWLETIASSADLSIIAIATGLDQIYLGTLEGAATESSDLGLLTAPGGVSGVVANGQLSVTSMTCYELDSGSVSLVAPLPSPTSDSYVSILGGVDYQVDCVSNGGSADATLRLGTNISDTSKLRVYRNSSGGLTDVTNQVTFSSVVVSGELRTAIHYSPIDGGGFDEDGAANSSIGVSLMIGLQQDPFATLSVSPRSSVCGLQNPADGFVKSSSAGSVDLGLINKDRIGQTAHDIAVDSNAANGVSVFVRGDHGSANLRTFTDSSGFTNFGIPEAEAFADSPNGPVKGQARLSYTVSSNYLGRNASWHGLTTANQPIANSTSGGISGECIGFSISTSPSIKAGYYSANVHFSAVPRF